jgi:hypothetical protein
MFWWGAIAVGWERAIAFWGVLVGRAIAFVDQMRSAIAIRNKSAIALSNNLLFS